MHPTRRAWLAVGLIGALVAWALLLDRVLPLVGAIGLAAWLLACQLRFARLLDGTLSDLAVDQRVASPRVVVDETTPLTLAVGHEAPLPVGLTVAGSLPAGADGETPRVSLAPGETEASRTVELSWPVAGAFTFAPADLTATDPAGLFTQRVAVGSQPSVTVEPRGPRNIHVGEGGEALAAGFGEHEAGRLGSGLEPAEVRKYVPGDAVRRMDWKATARLGEPHVREFEAETDRETVVVLDHRAAGSVGPPGETALAYLRQVALAFVDSAQEIADPLGCLTVGEDGITGRFEPRADAAHLRAIRRQLQAVDASEPGAASGGRGGASGGSDGGGSGGGEKEVGGTPARAVAAGSGRPGRLSAGGRRAAPRDPGEARRQAARLTDDAAFATRLRPFLDRPTDYVDRVESDPLFAAVRTATSAFSGRLWTVICTTDAARTEVREAVKLARRGDGAVLVFLAPTVLYEDGGLADLDRAYERYRSFESFRHDLAGMEGVRAFEVGPADRLSRVLDSGRAARDQRGGR